MLITRLKNKTGPSQCLKIIKTVIKTDQTTDTTQNSRTHVFKFLTPLTPSVEEIVNLLVFK